MTGTGHAAVVVEAGINGLGTIRSLGRRGIPVFGVDSKLKNYGAVSRYCRTVFCENVNDERLVGTLQKLGESLDKKGVLFCASDLSLLVVSRHREELAKYFSFVLPTHEVVETMMNKSLFHAFAEKNGVVVPKTVYTEGETQAREAGSRMTYPCVIKPQIRDSFWCQHVPDKILFAGSAEEYEGLLSRHGIMERPLIVQEWIDGGDEDVFFCLTYMNQDLEPLAVFTGKKIRQHPPLTGLTSAGRSIWVPEVAEEGVRILRAGNCTGICGVEFKYCRRDRMYKVTEPTVGRADLQEAISACSGLDIPYIAYCDAIGAPEKGPERFEEDVVWINEPLEFYSIRHYLRRGWAGPREILASFRGKRGYALGDFRDPMPLLRFIQDTLWNALRRRVFRKSDGRYGEDSARYLT